MIMYSSRATEPIVSNIKNAPDWQSVRVSNGILVAIFGLRDPSKRPLQMWFLSRSIILMAHCTILDIYFLSDADWMYLTDR